MLLAVAATHCSTLVYVITVVIASRAITQVITHAQAVALWHTVATYSRFVAGLARSHLRLHVVHAG